MSRPSFGVVSGRQVRQVLHGREKEMIGVVEHAYRLHGSGLTVNPPSYFLRFEDRPADRIIALPASVGGEDAVDGIKWISSFPGNITSGLPRASAVLVLNDPVTGYPYACLESSVISATRTAASAVLAADALAGDRRPRRVGFFGTGLIARYIHQFFHGSGWEFDEIGLHDLSADYAAGFAAHLEREGQQANITVHSGPRELIESSDLVVFATVAGTPHVTDPSWFAHNPLVLHVSLRDLAPEIILAATNVVDDVEHCLKANTSPHLAELQSGHRDFVHATLYDVLEGTARLPADRPVVFSPFGLGVLDLAVGKHIHDQLAASGDLVVVDDFFDELSRHG